MRVLAVEVALVVASLNLCAEEGLKTIEDVRVDALVESHWGQKSDTGYSNSGSPCFNYCTPDGYPCGCNATSLAQLFRYWRYPASIPSGTSRCKVDDVETVLGYGGSAYDYDAMPLVTAGADEVSRAAIGRLTYDCSVSLHSIFASGSTFAYGMFSFVQLREKFGYASAVGYVPKASSGYTAAIRNAIIANLDAKAPVLVTMKSSANDNVHQALIDGYGYNAGKLHFHYNLGWCNVRGDDAWYEPGKAVGHVSNAETYDFDLVDGLVYNVFPTESGEVLSGRVLDEDGNPVAGAAVAATCGGVVVGSTATDAAGIYAFVLPGGATYKVTCNGRSVSVSLTASVCAKRMITARQEGKIWEDPFHPVYNVEGTLGGSPGNDIRLVGNDPGDDPEDDPEEPSEWGAFNPTKAGTGAYPYSGVVYDADGNPRGTMTVKFTKPKKGASKISAAFKMMDGKSYSLAAVPVNVSDTAPARITDKAIKKFGALELLEVGEAGFAAEIASADGSKLVAVTTDLSVGLSQGVHALGVSGLPELVNGLPVLVDMLPNGAEFSVNGKGKITVAKAATLKYAKVKGAKPVAYERVCDTTKGKTNLSALKLTYTAKTSTVKGSFAVYTDDVAKHKINKYSFTINGMVIGGRIFGVATCKKPLMSCSIFAE